MRNNARRPSWNEVLRLELDPSGGSSHLEIEVWDNDGGFGRDDSLGALSLPVAAMLQNGAGRRPVTRFLRGRRALRRSSLTFSWVSDAGGDDDDDDDDDDVPPLSVSSDPLKEAAARLARLPDGAAAAAAAELNALLTKAVEAAAAAGAAAAEAAAAAEVAAKEQAEQLEQPESAGVGTGAEEQEPVARPVAPSLPPPSLPASTVAPPVVRREIRSMPAVEQERFADALETMMKNKVDAATGRELPQSSEYFRLAGYHGWPNDYCAHRQVYTEIYVKYPTN